MFFFAAKYYFRQKKRVIIYVIFLAISILGNLISPQLVGFLIDGLIIKRNINFIINFIIGLCLIQGFMMLTNYWLAIIGNLLRTKVSMKINFDILVHIQNLPYSFFEDRDLIYLTQRINNDSSIISSFVIENFKSFFSIVIMFSFSVIYISRLKPQLLIIILISILLYFTFYFILKYKVYKKGYEFKEAQSKFFSTLNMQLSQIMPMKLFNIYGYFHREYEISSNNLIKKLVSKQKTDYLSNNIDKSISILAQCFFFIILGLSVIYNEITIGQFTVMNTYFGYLIGTMGLLTTFKQSYIDCLISYTRIKELITLPIEQEGKYTFENIPIKNITIQDFSFNYNNHIELLKSVSYTFNFGEITSVIGKNGSGKTTLLLSILGLFKNEYTGSILFNTINIDNINMHLTRQKIIGFAPQNPIIFPYANIRQNILIGEKSDINNSNSTLFPNIYSVLNLQNTPINLSDKLSGGERQKISLLRIIENDYGVIILDEPTNDLDEGSRCELIQYLNNVRQSKLVILVTHDSDLLELSDKVINLDV